MHPSEIRVAAVVEACKSFLTDDELRDVSDYNHKHAEWGLSLEMLADILIEKDVELSEQQLLQMEETFASMQMDPGGRAEYLRDSRFKNLGEQVVAPNRSLPPTLKPMSTSSHETCPAVIPFPRSPPRSAQFNRSASGIQRVRCKNESPEKVWKSLSKETMRAPAVKAREASHASVHRCGEKVAEWLKELIRFSASAGSFRKATSGRTIKPW